MAEISSIDDEFAADRAAKGVSAYFALADEGQRSIEEIRERLSDVLLKMRADRRNRRLRS